MRVNINYQHWASIKVRYPDTIILLRDGDYYRTYKEDAETLDNLVGIEAIKVSAADAAIASIIQAGHKLAVCERTK